MSGFRRWVVGAVAMLAWCGVGWAQDSLGDGNVGDHSRIGADGTAYVTRVVPVPTTISTEARKVLARVVSDAAVPQTLAERRTGTDKWQARA